MVFHFLVFLVLSLLSLTGLFFSNFCFLFLSAKSKSIIIKLEGFKGNKVLVPSFFITSIPVTNTFSAVIFTLSTLPSLFLNWPLKILTLSAFLTSKFLFPYLTLSSGDRWTCRNFCLKCKGASYLYLRCFLGWLLWFQVRENLWFCILNYNHTIIVATFATAGHLIATSLAIGPLKIVPLGLPLSSLSTTAALSSNLILIPSGRIYSFFCLTMIAGTTVFLISGFPFFTAAKMKSPIPQLGDLPNTVFCPLTEIILRVLAPELSQVSIYD